LFFVNGRLIKSSSLQHAFRAAYDSLLHGRERHPVGVVFLQMPVGTVDVNVHPNKSEVRFVKESEVHHALRVAVRDTLVRAQLAPSLEVEAHEPQSLCSKRVKKPTPQAAGHWRGGNVKAETV
jgi:DNA mismatch repair protein MutL